MRRVCFYIKGESVFNPYSVTHEVHLSGVPQVTTAQPAQAKDFP